MKYSKRSIFLCMAIAMATYSVNGQPAGDAADQSQKAAVAFKTVDTRDINGAVTVVNLQDYLKNDDNKDVNSALTGRAGGLISSTNIWGMNGAIVIIDGIARDYADLVTEEVESITVLKGAAATILYGTRAAKGAILITTKRGQLGDNRINVHVNQGFATPKDYPDYLGSADYMELYNEARENDGYSATFTDIDNYRASDRNFYKYPDVDFYSKEFLKDFTYNTRANMEFTGGNERASFYANIGWYQDNQFVDFGELKSGGNQRFNVRGNLNAKLNDYIKATIDVAFIHSQYNGANNNYFTDATTMYPHKISTLIPISAIAEDYEEGQNFVANSRHIIDGQYLLGGSSEYKTNAFGAIYAGGYSRSVSRKFLLTQTLDFDLRNVLEGLKAQTIINTDYRNSYRLYFNDPYATYEPTWGVDADGNDVITNLTQYNSDSFSGNQNEGDLKQSRDFGVTAKVTYDKVLNDVHNFSALLLGTTSRVDTGGQYQLTTYSNAGLQLAYNFDHKYWFDFTGAMVNSTKLPSGGRLGFSPSVTVGWLISGEDFMSNATAVNYLKLTASAASVATDMGLSDFFRYDSAYSTGSSYGWCDGSSGTSNSQFSATRGANKDLSFIRRKELTIGLQGMMFDNRLSFDATFFTTRIDDQVVRREYGVPSFFTNLAPYENYGCDSYTGVDFMVNWNQKFGEFDVNFGFNGTYATSNVVTKDELYMYDYRNRTGRPVGGYFGLESDGFFNDDAEAAAANQSFGTAQAGDIKYKDQNDDGVIDMDDEVYLGRASAPFNYALNISVKYRDFNLFVQGTGNVGGNGMKSSNYYWVDGDDKYSAEVLNRWTPGTKDTATYPRLSSVASDNNCRYSDFWMYKTDRFNLSKVQITYTLPDRYLKGNLLKGLSVYVNGSNLLTVAKNREILERNIGSAPQCRYYNIGVSAKF